MSRIFLVMAVTGNIPTREFLRLLPVCRTDPGEELSR
jgi:hypothetical protein